MQNKLKTVTARLALASLTVVTALPALAQEQEVVSQAPESGAWKALGVAIAFGILLGIGCFMSPKRSHLD